MSEGGGARVPTAVVWGVLAVAIVVGAWLRLQGIDRSLTYDEIFTLVTFASKPWSAIASSYEVPNNHILHTFCVKLSAALFDSNDWAIRLPAAVAGIAAIGASFLLVKLLTRTTVAALVAVVLMALCQGQVSSSFQARGYTLLVLMSMLHAYCTWRALDSPGRWRWWTGSAAFGFAAALTVPSGIYLVSAVQLWALGCVLTRRIPSTSGSVSPRSAQMIWPFAAALVTTLVLIGAVYLPLREQLQVLSHQWGIPLSDDPGAVIDVWLGVLAQAGPSRWSLLSLVLGLVGVVTLVIERKRAGLLVLLIMAVPFALNLLMGVAGPSRVYVFATPFLVLLVARGVTAVPQLVRRIKPGLGTSILPLVLVGSITVAGYVPAAQDGPTDTGYRPFGKMITEEVGSGDLVVAPYIMDSSLGYYTQGLLLRQVREIILGEEGLQRLLIAARVGDVPRFSLADYMLTTNFTTAESGHADRYRNYEFPVDAFRVVRQTGNLRLFEALARPQAVISNPKRLAAEFWHVYYESHPNTTQISGSVDGETGNESLVLTSGDEATFVLHSKYRFSPGADGLLFLAYTRSAEMGGYASLYQAGSAAYPEDLWAVQMAKPLSASVELKGAASMPYAELCMIHAKTRQHYGVYIYSRGQVRQSFGNFELYFVPFMDG